MRAVDVEGDAFGAHVVECVEQRRSPVSRSPQRGNNFSNSILVASLLGRSQVSDPIDAPRTATTTGNRQLRLVGLHSFGEPLQRVAHRLGVPNLSRLRPLRRERNYRAWLADRRGCRPGKDRRRRTRIRPARRGADGFRRRSASLCRSDMDRRPGARDCLQKG